MRQFRVREREREISVRIAFGNLQSCRERNSKVMESVMSENWVSFVALIVERERERGKKVREIFLKRV